VKSAKDEGYGPVSASFRNLISWKVAECLTVPGAVITVICASVNGWSYHPKHVEQFREID
jgi:hypothetical protein